MVSKSEDSHKPKIHTSALKGVEGMGVENKVNIMLVLPQREVATRR